MSGTGFVAVATVGKVPPGRSLARDVAGQSVLICHYEDRFFAIENRCSHADSPLDCGRIRNGWIACPAHGARFDLETGEALTGPAEHAIRTYPLRVVGDAIEVAV